MKPVKVVEIPDVYDGLVIITPMPLQRCICNLIGYCVVDGGQTGLDGPVTIFNVATGVLFEEGRCLMELKWMKKIRHWFACKQNIYLGV